MFKQFIVSLASLSLIAAIACPKPPKPPTPTPTPHDRYVRFTVRGEDGHAPTGTTATIHDDFEHSYACPITDDRANCLLDSGIPIGQDPQGTLVGGHRLVVAPKYDAYADNFGFSGTSQDLNDVQLTLSFKPLVAIHPEGQHFRQDDGGRIVLIGATDFNLFARFANGEDISPILQQRQSAGYNSLRVFTAYNVTGIGNFSPKSDPAYYGKLPLFADKLAAYGLRVEFVAFTGPYDTFFASDGEKVDHWNKLCQATLAKTNVMRELVNEYDNAPNAGVPFDSLMPCGLSSHGSAIQDAAPKTPFWTYITFHPASGEFYRKAGHNCMELASDRPCVSNEFSRSPDQESQSYHWFDAGADCALLAGGCTFHSVDGKASQLWQGIELDNAINFANGMKSIPLYCQDFPYNHPNDGDYLRIHARGSDPACQAKVRP